MSAAALFLMLLSGSADAPPPPRVEFAQMTIQQRVIIRVPVRAVRDPQAVRVPMATAVWEERGSRKCLKMRDIRAATIERGQALHLILAHEDRYRIDLSRGCRATDFQAGFYLAPSADGRVCARRDVLQARSGISCEISRFRALVPQR